MAKTDDIKRQLFMTQTALHYSVVGQVRWSEPHTVSTVEGMPPRPMRIGLIDSGTDSYVLINDVNRLGVPVLTPDQAALWPVRTVQAFEGFEEWLLRHARIEWPVDIHTPGYSWVRKVIEDLKER